MKTQAANFTPELKNQKVPHCWWTSLLQLTKFQKPKQKWSSENFQTINVHKSALEKYRIEGERIIISINLV